MLSLVAILFALVLLLYAQLLRSVLARPLRTIQAKVLPADTQAPAALADLYQQADAELTALGFGQSVWVAEDCNLPGLSTTLFRVYRQTQEGSLLWLGPPVDLRYPNRLVSRFSTRLADGRTVCSQAFDPYFQLTATPEAPVRRLKGGTLEQQWSQHLRWRAQFQQVADPESLQEDAIAEEAGTRYNLRIERLVEHKRLWRDSAGVARARWGFGLRLLGGLLRRPARLRLNEPVPAARLAALSEIVEQARSNAVPPKVQWGLFAGSVVLFLLVSGLLWDQHFALVLLAVIGFHEAGHFVAMRGFGYRNVQMLMLPLVGGVTLGVERTPSAAQRAWMSLMGPLPGIVLGWALYGCIFFLAPPQPWPWLYPLATTLLVVNYLNVLPLPPLDGSRIVQALLPARWAGLQAVFVTVGCVVGGAAAFVVGYPRLSLIALITLITVPYLWQRRNVVRALLREEVPPRHLPVVTRLTRVLEMFERQKVPMKGAHARILQAEAVLQTLDAGRMVTAHRVALTGIYGILMVVPVAALAGYWAFEGGNLRPIAGGAFGPFGTFGAFGGDSGDRGYASARKDALAKAANMDVAQFVVELQKSENGTVPAGLSEERIGAVEARLGVKLPEDIRAVYRVSNGLKLLDLAPLEQATRPDAAFLSQISSAARDGEVQIATGGANLRDHLFYVSAARLTNTLQLGPAEKGGGHYGVLLDLNQPPLVDDYSLLNAFARSGQVSLHAIDVRGRLQESWVAQQAQDAMTHRYAREADAQAEALRDEDVSRLLAHFPEPGFLVRTFFQVRTLPLPEPASEKELTATEHGLGRSLPPDLRAFLLLHDGYPKLFLLPAAGYFPVPEGQAGATFLEEADQRHRELAAVWGGLDPSFDIEKLRACIVIGGVDQGDPRVFPTTLWCPDREGQIVDLQTGKSYPDVTALLREDVARRMVNSRSHR